MRSHGVLRSETVAVGTSVDIYVSTAFCLAVHGLVKSYMFPLHGLNLPWDFAFTMCFPIVRLRFFNMLINPAFPVCFALKKQCFQPSFSGGSSGDVFVRIPMILV